MARRDGIAALVLGLVAGAVIHQAAALPFGGARNPGPGFVPWWAGVALAGLSLLLGVQVVRARRGPGARRGVEAARGDWRRVAALLAALALYVVALDPLGYPISTFLLVLLMLRPATRRALVPALGLAVLAAGGSYVLFAVWLQVPLPPGALLR
ncbi:MAG: hypothetical protein A3I14_01145 [Candidatus Rokubacteria bacterium RIFCSPLOWO2_02_FULL_73_56]|nr:MAG: hypothetical protein A3D33_07625 [Candidatus Rokubacteria bacterium RIFCSPHIGHO2_02_FULL_73_26]OGL10320.1 MAG: hypothetical protein A3I14_01145 [Candidatus Rokubacteria bacterium RIFCSPLOWO2_02_FULL_73_56]